MNKPPRNSREPLFGWSEIAVAALDGLVLLTGVLGLYAWLHQTGVNEGQVRAASFIALVAGQLALAPAVMARSSGRAQAHHSRILWLVTAGASLLLALMLIVPELREIMRFAVPNVEQFALGLTLGIVSGGWSALRVFFSPRLCVEHGLSIQA